MPDCSVIVCTRYRAAPLRRCLESLRALDHSSHEVVVVDNTIGDPATETLASQAGARYVREPHIGLSRARNSGAVAAEGELIAYLDDDAAAETDWLEKHSAALADPTVMATTGRILPSSGSESASAGAQFLDLGGAPFQVNQEHPSWFEMANFGGLGFGGNMVFRRALFDSGLRFRESLGLGAPLGGGEELYAFFDIIRSGHTVAYVPDAVVRHDGPPVAPANLKAQQIAGTRRYSAYLFLLLVEEPEFRRRTMRQIVEASRHTPRPWRRVDRQQPKLKRRQALVAVGAGPLLYLRSRLRERSPNRP